MQTKIQTINLPFYFISPNLQYLQDFMEFTVYSDSNFTEETLSYVTGYQAFSGYSISVSDRDILLEYLHNTNIQDLHYKGFVYRYLTPSYYFALRQKFSILKKLFLLKKIQESDYLAYFERFSFIHNQLQIIYSKEFIVSEYENFKKTYSNNNTYNFPSYDPTRDLLKRSSRVA